MNKKTIALILGVLCVATSLFGIYKATSTSFFEIPVVKMMLGEENFATATEALEGAVFEAENAPKEKVEEFEATSNVKWDSIIAFLKNPSINRALSVGGSLNKVAPDLDFGESIAKLGIIRLVIIVYGALVALFSLLGALLKKKVFPIIAMVLSLGYFLIFVGAIYLVLFFALSIAHIVLLSKSKDEAAPEPIA